MSLLDKASLVVTPNGYKVGKLYSVIPNTTLGDMDVVRATTATRVNSLGLIENVALNVPRIDYTNGSCPSILVEPQRTNRLLNSEIVATQTITTTAVATIVSFYGTGTITFTGSYVGSLVGTGVNNRVSLTFTPTVGSLILTVVGSCAKGQLETGIYATSYIPTIATTVTRNADVISKTGISSLIGQTEGTIFLDYNLINFENQEVTINNVYTNAISLGFLTDGTFKFRCLIFSNSIATTLNSSTISTLGNYKIAIKYKSGENKLFINGVLVTTNTATLNFTASLSSIFLNTSTAVYFGNNSKSLKNTQLYKTALTDAECIALTTL